MAVRVARTTRKTKTRKTTARKPVAKRRNAANPNPTAPAWASCPSPDKRYVCSGAMTALYSRRASGTCSSKLGMKVCGTITGVISRSGSFFWRNVRKPHKSFPKYTQSLCGAAASFSF